MTVGRRKVVPTHALLQLVGWPDDLIAQALGVRLESETGVQPRGTFSDLGPEDRVYVYDTR